MTRLGVLGWPVAHSLSPVMQRAALRAVGLDGWAYQLLPVPPELFDETVRALPAAGFLGANVTIPHKEAALALADDATPLAREIGAANTLTFGEQGIEADNTDAPGLLAAIGQAPRSALVLGAGGSARAAVHALAGAGCEVFVLARTPARALGLPATVVDRPVEAEALVNCTPIGLHDPDELPLDPSGFELVVDFVYRSGGGTALTRAARGRVVDGLELLVQQGALAFSRWTGRQAPLEAMRAAVQIP